MPDLEDLVLVERDENLPRLEPRYRPERCPRRRLSDKIWHQVKSNSLRTSLVWNSLAAVAEVRLCGLDIPTSLIRQLSFRTGGGDIPIRYQCLQQFARDRQVGPKHDP